MEKLIDYIARWKKYQQQGGDKLFIEYADDFIFRNSDNSTLDNIMQACGFTSLKETRAALTQLLSSAEL